MNTIWKYVIDPAKYSGDWYEIDLPLGAEILTVGEQHNDIVIWAKVDPDHNHVERRKFAIVGTGHNIPEGNVEFLGTAKLMNSALILHVFEKV